MEFHRNSTPPVDPGTSVVTGPTLSEAFKRVRQEFGPEAVISGSRTRSRPKGNGSETEKVFEVLVETGDPLSRGTDTNEENLTEEIRQEVERLEKMVQEICRTGTGPTEEASTAPGNPLAEHLVENGASRNAVDRLLTRFAGETGKPRNDRPGAIAWLMGYLGTGKAELAQWEGNHVFLCEHDADRLGLVTQLARRMAETDRRVLVISVLPDPDRDEPRLKNKASNAGYDAAVVRNVDQLQDMEDHLAGYDLVFLDLPGLTDPHLAEGGPIHRWLASNPKFHRHLLMPMDRDFLDLDDLREAVRSWNCDWLALTRMDGTRRAAKLLDLIDSIPLPISFMAENVLGEGVLASGTAELLLDRILASEKSVKFRPGVETEGS
jgi:hypothetical protein